MNVRCFTRDNVNYTFLLTLSENEETETVVDPDAHPIVVACSSQMAIDVMMVLSDDSLFEWFKSRQREETIKADINIAEATPVPKSKPMPYINDVRSDDLVFFDDSNKSEPARTWILRIDGDKATFTIDFLHNIVYFKTEKHRDRFSALEFEWQSQVTSAVMWGDVMVLVNPDVPSEGFWSQHFKTIFFKHQASRNSFLSFNKDERTIYCLEKLHFFGEERLRIAHSSDIGVAHIIWHPKHRLGWYDGYTPTVIYDAPNKIIYCAACHIMNNLHVTSRELFNKVLRAAVPVHQIETERVNRAALGEFVQ